MEDPAADSSLIIRGRLDEVCQRIRDALDPVLIHAVSLYDHAGRLLWMTSSVLDDDVAARKAFKSFSAARPSSVFVAQLGNESGRPQSDSRSAVIFRVRDTRDRQVGGVMVIVNSAMLAHDGAVESQLLTEALGRELANFAVLRSLPAELRRTMEIASAAPTVNAKSAEPSVAIAPKAPPAARPLAPIKIAKSRATAVVHSPIPAKKDPLLEALRQSELLLYVQRLVALEDNARLERFEVLWEFEPTVQARTARKAVKSLLAGQPSSLIDRRVFAELIKWLKQHPTVYRDRSTRLSLKLSKSALNDPQFVPFVRRLLDGSGLPKGTLGVEIPAATPRRYAAAITRLAASLQQEGCFIALDNFSLRSEAVAALHLPGVQLIKLSHEMTVKIDSDKVSRAAISAITQMARVLGIQTVAKRTKLETDLLRLTSYGVDFVQSESIAPAAPIAFLATG